MSDHYEPMPTLTWAELAGKTRDRGQILLTYASWSVWASGAFIVAGGVLGLVWAFGSRDPSYWRAAIVMMAVAMFMSLRGEILLAHTDVASCLSMLYDQEGRDDA